MTNEDETPHENRNKRVRVNEEANTSIEANEPATPKENLPPSAASRAALKEAVASHPDAIKEVAEALLKDYVSLKNQERQEANTMSHFDDTAWMPRSARVKFSLTSSESLMETEDFKKLSAEATAATAAFQHKAKSLIKSVLKMAIKETKSRFKELMERALFRFGAMILLEDKAYTDEPPTEKFVWYCLSKDNIPARVFEYTETRKLALESTFYQKANDRVAQKSADDKAKATNDRMDTDDTAAAPSVIPATQPPAVTATIPTADISAGEAVYFQTLLPKFVSLLTALFATCWEHQLAAQAKLDSNRRLKKQAQEFLKGDKSKDTAIDLEKEPKIEPKRISELVKKEVEKATGKLNKKVDRVSQQQNRSVKNGPRGAPQKQRQQQEKQPSSPASASSKKKKATEKKKGQNTNNNNGTRGRAPSRDAAKKDNASPQRGRGNSRDSKGNDKRKGKPDKKNNGGPNKQKGRPRSTSTGRQRASNR